MRFLLASLCLLPALGWATALPPDDHTGRSSQNRLAELPLDRQGIPTRPLEDGELHRLLMALSATNEPATILLARCHAGGTPYGTPGWRSCVTGDR